jgi:hypothetical protein
LGNQRTSIEEKKMSQAIGVQSRQAVTKACDPEDRITRSLLGYGVIAGPIYVLVGLIEGLTRPGFDLTRHDLSLLSNGHLGWIHIALLVVTGAMTIAGAAGMARAVGSSWGPRLVGAYGLALIAAGALVADPMDGFPIGTPAGRPEVVSWHGAGHLLAAGIGFACLIAACFWFARFFRRANNGGWSVYSAVSGSLFLGGFVVALAISGEGASVPALWGAVLVVWTWLSLVSVHLYRITPELRTPGRPTVSPQVELGMAS